MTEICRVAVIMTCHNRRNVTQRCLESLRRQDLRAERTMQVFLNDDGSSDGTAEMAAEFPNVTVLRGSGEDYWAGGMRRAWSAAEAMGPDVFVFLNDDVVLDDRTVEALLVMVETVPDALWGAAVRDPATGLASYGGYLAGTWRRPMRLRRVSPKSTAVDCDLLNGNILLVPREVAARVGGLDPAFTHGMADFDLTWRARKGGNGVILAPGTWGMCAFNKADGSWRDRSLSRRDRMAKLLQPTGLPVREWLRFCVRHGGIAFPLEFLAPYLRVAIRR